MVHEGTRIRQQIQILPDVTSIHHLHLWSLDGEHHVLTAHLVVNDGMNIPAQIKLKQDIALLLSEYQLAHTTIELEFDGELCRDDSRQFKEVCK